MDIFENLIDTLNSLNLEVAPRHLKYKIDIADKIIKGKYNYETSFERKIPYYLNDLGVREFKDIKYEMKYLSRKYNFVLPSTCDIQNSLNNKKIDELSLWMDMAIFLTGDYKALENVILNRYEEIKYCLDYNLLIFSGTVLAVMKDIRSLDLFIAAQNIECAKNYENVGIAKHRLAVTYLKRFGDIQSCQNIIDELFAMKNLKITGQLMIYALANNLYALCFLLNGKENWNKHELKIIMNNAKVFIELLLDNPIATLEEKDRATRYLSQININYAQILQKNNKYFEAVSILKENLVTIENTSQFYLSEALGTLGYALFLNSEFLEAIDVLNRAKVLYTNEGAFNSVVLVNKLLLIAYYKVHDLKNVVKIEEELCDVGIYLD